MNKTIHINYKINAHKNIKVEHNSIIKHHINNHIHVDSNSAGYIHNHDKYKNERALDIRIH